MVKPPSEHFQFSLKWAIFERFEKKVSKSDWNHIHKVCVTQIHDNTQYMVYDRSFAKNAPILGKNLSAFWLFSGVLEVK